MALVRKHLAHIAVLTGAALFLAGVALVYVPAAFILAGAALIAAGLFGVEVDR